MPTVSIIIPVYNAEKYIDETIQSVIKQTFTDWELIIVNDGSTDKTKDIIGLYGSTKNIKIIQKNNTGVSDSRNVGARNASGLFYCFLDADDLLTPNCLQKRVETATLFPEKLIHNDIEEIDSSGAKRNTIFSGISGNVFEEMLKWQATVIPGPSSIILSKTLFNYVQGFDIGLSTAADQDFFIRVTQKYEALRIPEILTLYRIHPHNMHQNIPLMEKDHIAVFKKAAKNDLFKSFSFKRKCFSNLYLILAGSCWKEGNNKVKAFYYIVKAFISYPPSLIKIFKKI